MEMKHAPNGTDRIERNSCYSLFRIVPRGCLALFAALVIAGCTSTTKPTSTTRSATEELLLSTAADRALQNVGLEIFAGRKVFLDTTYFDSIDSKYVLGTIRDGLSRAGALLTDAATNSEIIIEARSGGLAIDQSDTVFGIPKFPVPLSLAGGISTPEMAFYESDHERSYAKFTLMARNRQTSAHIYSSGPLDGKAYDESHRILFISWHRTNVPEKQSGETQTQEAPTWSPEYDLQNLTATNGAAKLGNVQK